MGRTGDAWFGQLTDDALDRRTVEEIEEKLTEQSKRNAVSRIIRAVNDKVRIVGWMSDLDRILRVFNVRSVIFTRSSPIVSFQIESIMNIHVTTSDVKHGVLEIQKEVRGQARWVSTNRIQSVDDGVGSAEERPGRDQSHSLSSGGDPFG